MSVIADYEVVSVTRSQRKDASGTPQAHNEAVLRDTRQGYPDAGDGVWMGPSLTVGAFEHVFKFEPGQKLRVTTAVVIDASKDVG
jgi:hypothetical protein